MKFTLVVLALFIAAISALTLKSNLKTEIEKNGNAHVFVILKDHVDFRAMQKAMATKFDTMEESKRGKLVVNSLKDLARASQKNIVKYLRANNIKFDAHWISNTIAIEKANVALLEKLEKDFPEIEAFDLVENATIIDEIKPEPEQKNQGVVEAGVQWVKAPEVWKKGVKGKGVVVGVIDTGAFLHNDLKKYYRGRNGDHKASWLDATSLRRAEPYDDNIHGTHCHGTVTASSPQETVGVAPEAEWISCKFLTARGSGSYNDAVKCYEFMLAPNGDSDLRPHVVSNSYGGGVPTAALERALDALLAAGVEMVFAAGNSGSRCSSVLMPAGYAQAYSVGALNRNSDTLARFSSRGPGRNGLLKPEISAPGASVKSTSNQGGYRTLSGTSMACPHVAGVIALLWSGRPELARNIEKTREILNETAKGQESTECSSSQRSPNNLYGYGTVNALKALEESENVSILEKLTKMI